MCECARPMNVHSFARAAPVAQLAARGGLAIHGTQPAWWSYSHDNHTAMTTKHRQLLGWLAVGLSTLAASYWAFWGIIENFHEGWWHPSLGMRIAQLLGMYLLFTNLFVATGLIGLYWPRLGGSLHILAGLWALWFFQAASPLLVLPFMFGPLIATGVAYWFGRPSPRRLAAGVLCGVPLLTMLAFGVEPAWRVAHRVDDGDRRARRLAGNGVDLIWAPQGPGWPTAGVSWYEAVQRCQYLESDGLTLATKPRGIWRLPTMEEAVRSMHRGGQNCGGNWDPTHWKASYRRTPDKESPLWDTHSQVVYWWTATEISEKQALIIVYDGKAWPRPKDFRPGYLGFRAVKDPVPEFQD